MTRFTQDQLRSASCVVEYERNMLRACARLLSTPHVAQALGDRAVMEAVGPIIVPTQAFSMLGTIQNVLVEGFVLHARCLIEFLYYDPNKTYIRAADYFDRPVTWETARGPKTPLVRDTEARASALAVHVSVRRLELLADQDKSWDVVAIAQELGALSARFLGLAPAERIHAEVRARLAR